MKLFAAAAALALALSAASTALAAPPALDLIIRNGTIYDGSGGKPFHGDVAIKGDRIAYVGPHAPGKGVREIDAKGQAVSPGFINMLSQAAVTLIADPRGLSDLKQGVTLEVLAEGNSMGPLNPEMKRLMQTQQADIHFPVEWTTLGEYLDFMEKRGVSLNIASFVGAATVRVHEIGAGDVDPTPEQLARMRALMVQGMEEGAVGVSTGLIYTPGIFAETDELVALATESGRCGGIYISHMRSEGNQLLEGVDELIDISRRSGAPAEIYHIKAAGRPNWDKLNPMLAKVEAARASGLRITADMYTYPASSTGFDAAMPAWVRAGGVEKWIERMKDPAIRARLLAEMTADRMTFESSYRQVGPDGTILVGFKNPKLKPLAGKTLGQVARERGTTPENTIIDLIIEDGTRIQVVYFSMDEKNVARETAIPWVSFGSDAGAQAPEGVFLLSSTHPRTYGNFARLLAKYVRDEKRLTLQEAVRKLAALPAHNLGLHDRGLLKTGYFADVVVFDPATIQDHATYEKPQQLATGVSDVVVNGQLALADGEPTDNRPGKVVRGRAWTGWKDGGCRPSAKDWTW